MTTDLHAERILILDFGSQYTQLIARRVRELGVYCELHPYTMSDAAIRAFRPAGIILSGGPESVTSEHTPRAPQSVFAMEVPVLGICYGMQTMAHQLQGSVANGAKREFGKAKVSQQIASPLLQDIHSEFTVWMSHGDHVETLPQGFSQIASSGSSGITAMADEARRFYGLQFHPEVSHTPDGLAILKNFVLTICGCQAIWTTDNIIEESLQKIRDQVGTDHVILGLSGGVDSSVVAALLHKAIGDQLTCVFVDNGLLRLNEAAEVQRLFAEHLKMKLVVLSAEDVFLSRLKGVADPEQKRKVIGQLFVELFEEQASKIEGAKWLAQGTIYPDVIESATQDNSSTHTIKSHHNVGGLPQDMTLKLLEPLRELFKDEVRELGLRLGLPESLIYRHPFPGPGLGVRILGEVHKAYADTLRLADAILIEELHAHDLYKKVSQAFVVFLPIKSVGVLGDARHYDHVVAVRVVETSDFMTAHWSHLPYTFLETVSSRIINEVPGVSRVTYDISNKPPATIEWE